MSCGWYDVSHPRYATKASPIQSAIDDAVAANGGVVHIPTVYGPPDTITIPYVPGDPTTPLGPIVLLGTSPEASGIQKFPLQTFDLLHVERSHVTIRNLTFNGNRALSGVDKGIVVGSASGNIRNVFISDCIIRNTRSHALHVIGGSGAPMSRLNRFVRCDFGANDNLSALVRIGAGCSEQMFETCGFHFFWNEALLLEGCQRVSCYDCNFESANGSDTTRAYVYGNAAHNSRFVNCWFEEPDEATAAKWFLDLYGSNAVSVLGCSFVRKFGTAPKAIRVGDPATGGHCLGAMIVNPRLVLFNDLTPDSEGHIEVRNPESECTLIGGHFMAGSTAPSTKVLDMTDPSSKSWWLSNRRWRMPVITDSESPSPGYPTLHLGDVLVRANRGLEAWNAHSGQPSWIPLTVNRYASQAALTGIPSTSKNRGTLAWVDDEGKLKVWDGSIWRILSLAP